MDDIRLSLLNVKNVARGRGMVTYFLLHHLGLGDHIICNGLVRELLQHCDRLYFPVKKYNLLTVSRMFRDVNDQIEYLPVLPDDNVQYGEGSDVSEMMSYYNLYKHTCDKSIRLGMFREPNFTAKNVNSFCKLFYTHADIPYEKRWTSFYIDYDRSKFLQYDHQQSYNFVHDDPSRSYVIDQSYKSHKYYAPEHVLGQASDHTIFDYYDIVKNSQTIHCMDSSFCLWLDHVEEIKDKEKYIHRYAKANKISGGMWPVYKNNWVILKSPEIYQV